MRHGKKFNHLSRTAPHRKAMLANMASSLILHKRINTTLAKAKALRVYVEPLLTKAKDDTTHSRRTVFAYLKDKTAVSELFRDVSVKIADRPGGYTRIIKLENRLGDNAEMAMIELVDFNETMLAATQTAKAPEKKTRRSAGKKASDESGSSAKAQASGAGKEAAPKDEASAKAQAAAEVKSTETNAQNALTSAEGLADETTPFPEDKAAPHTDTPAADASDESTAPAPKE